MAPFRTLSAMSSLCCHLWLVIVFTREKCHLAHVDDNLCKMLLPNIAWMTSNLTICNVPNAPLKAKTCSSKTLKHCGSFLTKYFPFLLWKSARRRFVYIFEIAVLRQHSILFNLSTLYTPQLYTNCLTSRLGSAAPAAHPSWAVFPCDNRMLRGKHCEKCAY